MPRRNEWRYSTALVEMSGQLPAPVTFTLGLSPQNPQSWRQGGARNRSVSFGGEINLLCLSGIEPQFLGPPSRSLDAT